MSVVALQCKSYGHKKSHLISSILSTLLRCFSIVLYWISKVFQYFLEGNVWCGIEFTEKKQYPLEQLFDKKSLFLIFKLSEVFLALLCQTKGCFQPVLSDYVLH